MSAKFGELLGRLVPLTGQDVAEILEEQKMSHRRFGQIALSWGLCQPEHVWQAWCEQLSNYPERIDLDRIGIDTQAIGLIPAEVARQFGVIPIRALSRRMVVAASEQTLDDAVENLPRLLSQQVQFVVADADQIRRAIATHYSVSHHLPLKRKIA